MKEESPHHHQAQAQHPQPQMTLHLSQDEGQVIQEQKLEKEDRRGEDILRKKRMAKKKVRRMKKY